MRHVLRVLVAVTSVLTVVSPATPVPSIPLPTIGPSSNASCTPRSMADFIAVGRQRPVVRLEHRLLFGTVGRQHRQHVQLPNACRRHDFGYRNLKLLERRYATAPCWNAVSRRRVDQQFLADMKRHCRSRPWYDEAPCFVWADDVLHRRPRRRRAIAPVRVRVARAVDAEGHPQQLVQHARRGTPDGLVVELEEEDRAAFAVDVRQHLLPERIRPGQVDQRHPDDAVDLLRGRPQRRAVRRCAPTTGTM